MKKTIFLLLSVLLMTSCSSLDTRKQTPIYQQYIADNKLEALQKITTFRFHGWRSLNNYFLIVSTSMAKPYLIELNSYCLDLRFANAIVINNSGSILQTKFDSVSAANYPNQKCYIKSIYKVTKNQADEITDLKLNRGENKEQVKSS
ncbi:MAG: DUF6491 family protein [Enterobacterales bacterium]|nr:DUF6491 family protein [Enterobacterales bacterium]